MAGKINIGGTEYNDISSGEVHIDGTLHSVSSGRVSLADGGVGDIAITEQLFDAVYTADGAYIVPISGQYEITAVGGGGAAGSITQTTNTFANQTELACGAGGGSGYVSTDVFSLSAGEVLTISIGAGGYNPYDTTMYRESYTTGDSIGYPSTAYNSTFYNSWSEGFGASTIIKNSDGVKLISAEGGSPGEHGKSLITYVSNYQLYAPSIAVSAVNSNYINQEYTAICAIGGQGNNQGGNAYKYVFVTAFDASTGAITWNQIGSYPDNTGGQGYNYSSISNPTDYEFGRGSSFAATRGGDGGVIIRYLGRS